LIILIKTAAPHQFTMYLERRLCCNRFAPCAAAFFRLPSSYSRASPAIIFAQNSYWQESAKIFNSPSVAVIKIEIAPAFLNYVLDPANAESDSLFPARLVFQNAEIPADTLNPVGFRLRGNTSRRAQKKIVQARPE